jgi:hypothetical protein
MLQHRQVDETERLVRIDGRDLDAFELIYARDTDRRLFRVIDGPSAVHWERLCLIARRSSAFFTTKEAGEISVSRIDRLFGSLPSGNTSEP